MSSFEGKIALVTGSTQGLGEAIAHRFADDGASGLVVCGRNAARGEAVAVALAAKGVDALFVQVELGNVDSVRSLVAAADDRFGRIDSLVNAGAVTTRGTIIDTTPELFDEHIAVNTKAPFFLMQDVIKIMRRETIAGTIVTIGSVAAYGAMPVLAPYSLSKGALMTLTRNVAYAVAWDRIRVNMLNIGWMDTPGEDEIQRRFHSGGEDWLEKAEAQMPFGRLLKPDEVAKAVAFLASSDSGMMTGAVVDFNQGIVGAGNAPIPTPDERPA